MSLHKILSVPLYVAKTELDNEKVFKLLEQELWCPYHKRTSQTVPDLHTNPDFNFLLDCIAENYNAYMQSINQPIHNFNFVHMWANHFDDAGIHYHTHQNSFISGVYYVKQPEIPTPTVYSSSWVESFMLHNKIIIDEYVEVEEGDLVLFPSFVPHYSEPAKDRITISFNILPTELGTMKNLNYARIFK